MARSLRLFVLCAATALCAFTAAAAKASLTPTLLGGGLKTPSLITTPTLLGGGLTSSLTGATAASCGATTTAFAQWGDPNSYYFTENGGFESGSSGWTLSGGAKVVPGNEPFYLHSSTDSSSLLLPNGASATSASLCFNQGDGGIRFLAVSPSGSGSLRVQVIVHGLLGVLGVLDGGTIQAGSTWAPTQVLSTLGSQLNANVGTTTIQVVLTAIGNVQVDDLYIDPWEHA
jgi:hypothetical protein